MVHFSLANGEQDNIKVAVGSASPVSTITTAVTAAGGGGTASSMDALDAATDHMVSRMLSESKEYDTIVKGLAVLEEQLRRAQQDIATLKELKGQALAAPEAFIERLSLKKTLVLAARQCQQHERQDIDNELSLSPGREVVPPLQEPPQLQRVALLPNINLGPWLGRLPRRATTKYDQNLEFILAKLGEMQARRPAPATDELVLSSLLPLPSSGSPALTGYGGGSEVVTTTVDGSVSLVTERVRRKFREIAGSWRSASAPALLPVPPSSTSYAGADRSSLFSPQPLKAQSIQFSLPFAPASAMAASSADVSPVKRTRSSLGGISTSSMVSSTGTGSAPSSPLATNAPSVSKTASTPSPSPTSGSGERKRRKKLTTPEESPHHNLPWTEEERRRLDELMAIYPEEQISTRRYAKIAAALGTRTAAQVANRINKLLHKQRRHGVPPVTMDVEAVADAQLRSTKEWHQYEMLKKQISMLETNPDTTVHAGFCCDRCGMDPILGVRWRCTRCVEPDAVDLCGTCYEQRGTFSTATHRSDHRFLPHKE